MAKIIHGKWKSKEYNSWQHMKRRCNDPNHAKYKDYGARGITVCDRWQSFEMFYADMGDAPSASHTIDRIENNGNYEPSNCRWATKKEQSNNKRNTRLVAYMGEIKSFSEWAEAANMTRDILRTRVDKLGWDFGRAIGTPVKHRAS